MYVRRASFVLAFMLAALAAPVARAAQSAASLGGGPNQWAVLVGVENGSGHSGLQLRGDLELGQRRLSPAVGFSIVGSLGYTRFSDSGGYYDFLSGFDNRWTSTLNLFKFGGAARFIFGQSQTVRPYADAGLGLYWAGSSDSQTAYLGFPYYQYVKQTYHDSDVGLFLRLAGGVSFQVSPGFALGVELGFLPYLGKMPDQTFTSLMGSATFRM